MDFRFHTIRITNRFKVSCYSNIIILKFYNWLVGHKNNNF